MPTPEVTVETHPYRDTEFTVTLDHRPAVEELKELQRLRGYHPSGYGSYDHRIVEKDGRFVAKWKCYRSCD